MMVTNEDGAEIDSIEVIRDNDKLYFVEKIIIQKTKFKKKCMRYKIISVKKMNSKLRKKKRRYDIIGCKMYYCWSKKM